MTTKFTNNATGELNASITNVATSLTLKTGQGDRFPAVAAPDIFYATLEDVGGNKEIVKCTARTAGSNTLTIVRAQDGTTAKAFAGDSKCELRLTAGVISGMITDIAAAVTPSATPAAGDVLHYSGSVWTPQPGGRRNIIINGDMNIWQRNTSFVSPTDGTWITDKWEVMTSSDGAVSILRDTGSPSSAVYNYNLYVDVTTADTSLGSTQHLALAQRIEGYDLLRAVGYALVVSFWVKSNKTGTYGVALRKGKQTTDVRNCTGSYVINSSGVWEYKTVVFPVFNPTSIGGTWDFMSGQGMNLVFALAAGSSYTTSSLLTWDALGDLAPTGQVNLLDSTSNYWQVTGVQLEVGTVATPFAFLPFGEQLSLCQRYYEKSYDLAVVPGTVSSAGAYLWIDPIASGYTHVGYRASKRKTPSVVFYSPVTGLINRYRDYNSSVDHTASVAQESGESGFDFYAGTGHGAAAETLGFHWTSDAEIFWNE